MTNDDCTGTVVQYGPIKLPAEETDPRVDDPTRPPNFYYDTSRRIYSVMRRGIGIGIGCVCRRSFWYPYGFFLCSSVNAPFFFLFLSCITGHLHAE